MAIAAGVSDGLGMGNNARAALLTRGLAEIARLVSDWEPESLIVGVPSHPDGAPLPNTAFCQRFANQLRGRFSKPVIELNENFTSLAARDRSGRQIKALLGSASIDADESIDALAAVEILEQFLRA